MNGQKLDELLEQLRKEIEHVEQVDEKGRELLRELSADIRDLLEREKGGQTASMLGKVKQALEHFEVTHPDLTAALANVSAILSNAGI